LPIKGVKPKVLNQAKAQKELKALRKQASIEVLRPQSGRTVDHFLGYKQPDIKFFPQI
jgi:hypothetical protein